MILNPKALTEFCSYLKIESKELGLVPLRLLGSQKMLLQEVCSGLANGTHISIILKARQLGISTICLALDLYWLFRNKGVQGTLVTDSEDNREYFRSIVTGYMDSLPKEVKIPIRAHNRTLLELKNRSRLNYQVSGARATGRMGRGKGLSYIHATEVSSWRDPEGIASLFASTAEKNPKRLYMFESTARGFNVFYDMWQEAKKSMSQKAIFIGWWMNENYQAKPESKIYNVYGTERPTAQESEWIDAVKSLYGYEITKEQLAWWRWKLNDIMKDESLMMQEFPPTEDHAFILSGYRFFSTSRITKYKMAVAKIPEPKYYSYTFGVSFDLTDLSRGINFNADLRVWEEPDSLGYYVIGADPAYGSSPKSDQSCVQVLRCYADGVEQVAEYANRECNTYHFAWVIAHLAGAYRNSSVILEVNGPGMAVWQELQRVQQTGGYFTPSESKGLLDVLGNIRHYLYHRPDSLSGSYAYHWKTTADTRERMLNEFKGLFERGLIDIRSNDLIEEMRYITNEHGYIGPGSSRAKDDRVMAMAMAVEGYREMVLPELYEKGLTRAESFRIRETMQPGANNVLAWNLREFLRQFRGQEEELM